jgi:hypothetical protein
VKYDEWSSLAIHIALDNTLVVSDISKRSGLMDGNKV